MEEAGSGVVASTCGGTPTGTFTLHAVSPDVAQADAAVFSVAL